MTSLPSWKSLYQLNRCMERARFMSRLVSVQAGQVSQDSPKTLALGWDWIFKSFNTKPPAGNILSSDESEEFCQTDAYTLVDYLTFEKEHRPSILACFHSAEEEILAQEKELSPAVKSQFDQIFLRLKSSQMRDMWPGKTLEFYQQLRQGIDLFYAAQGVSLYRGAGFGFLQLGRFVEQMERMVSFLEVYAKVIVGWKDIDKELFSLLLYLDMFDLYRQTSRPEMNLKKVFDFIVSSDKAPGSIIFSLLEVEKSTAIIHQSLKIPAFSKVGEMIQKLKRTILEEKKGALESFTEELHIQSLELQDEIDEFYFQHSSLGGEEKKDKI